jgi:PDZ domain-containing protein
MDSYTAETKIALKVLRGNNEVVFESTVIPVLYTDAFGVTKNTFDLAALLEEYRLVDFSTLTPKITILPATSIGSSGGSMMSLYLYNKITEGDITNGKIIMGTGTIDETGSIGMIGGIKQKMVTASKINDLAVFFVPIANYDEAKIIYDRYNCEFALIKIASFHDIIVYLEGLTTDE